MRSKSCPKAGIYFSHYECFGHTSIVMAVGEVFKKRFPRGNLFFIQAGLDQPQAKLDQLGEIYSLPGAFVDRRNFRELAYGLGGNTDKRSQVCADIVTRQRPDLFITETFPLGWEECRHELYASLVELSSRGIGLWAVAGHPLVTALNNRWRDKILKLYQQIIIFSPILEKELIAGFFTKTSDKKKYLEFFKRHAQKVKFAGYSLPRQEIVFDDDINRFKPPVPKDVCRVAVVRGGGAFYPKVIAQAISASDLLGKEYYLTVVAGPSTTTQEWDLFTALVAKKKINNLLLLKSLGDYEGLIKQSDLCIAMAGYNTAVMLLKHRKRAVVIPFEGYGSMTFHEQPARAVLLKEMIGAKVLSIHKLTADALAKAVRDAAIRPKVSARIPKEWFSGGDVLDKALTNHFDH